MRHGAIALVTAAMVAGSGTAGNAQTDAEPAPGGASILLELNGAAPLDSGACRLTVVTTSRLDRDLARAAWQVAIFDPSGIVQSLPVLDFGPLTAGKTKVAIFDLPGNGCDGIGRIVVNDVAECRAESGADLRDECLAGLTTRTRTDIDFGL